MGDNNKKRKNNSPGGKIILGSLKCEEGKIVSISQEELLRSEKDTIIDGKGSYLSPGFIDVHTHGAGGHDFMDGTVEAFLKIAEMHASMEQLLYCLQH